MNMAFDIKTDDLDVALLGAIQDGLPLCERPYREIGNQLKISETQVIDRLETMCNSGIIRRFGLVLQHHSLGYRANAMVVFDIDDEEVDNFARQIISHDFVTLCYCRTRRAPKWPYNLYCMIHGQERSTVENQIIELKQTAGLANHPSQTLFSTRRFKQNGARFIAPPPITRKVD